MSTFEYSRGGWHDIEVHCRRNSRQFKAGVPEKNFRIELCMVDKGFRGRQYQKTTLASNPKRDYHNTSSVTEMMDELSWTTLEERRSKTRLINFYKISNNKMEMPYRHAYTKSIENI
jgi:hypothetical protein